MAARKLRIAVPVTAVLFLALSVAALALYLPGSDGFFFQRALGFQVLPDGDFLVTDGGGADWSDRGSKVFIIDAGGRLRWLHEGDLHFAHSSIMLRNGNILVPDTNADASSSWTVPARPSGRANPGAEALAGSRMAPG